MLVGAAGAALLPGLCARAAGALPAPWGRTGRVHGRRPLRLVTFERAGRRGERLGAHLPDAAEPGVIVDLGRALALGRGAGDGADAEAEAGLPCEPLAFLRAGPAAQDAARDALAFVTAALGRGDEERLARAGALVAPSQAILHAPVPRPGKILGVARNYAAHAREQGRAAPPEEPVLFLKASSAVIGPGAEILLPAASRQVDYEGELAVVVGAPARQVPVANALAYVAGYTAANDVSARDYQDARGQRFIGKSCDTFAPLGPALVTADEIPDPQKLALTTRVTGELLQVASTADMIFSVAEILCFASNLMTLEPGDVILTGTPAGVGRARRPPRWLRDGDLVEVSVERVGTLRNRVRAAPAQ